MSTNPYSSQSIAGYNTSPPPDDGSETSANKLEWNKGKTKLADPIKTLSEAINTAVSAAHAKGVNTDAAVRNQISGSLAFEWATATLATDTINPDASAVFVGAQSGATSDTLQTILTTNTYDGALLTLRARHATEEIVVVHATSTAATATNPNIFLTGKQDITLGTVEKSLTLQRDDNISGGWAQIAETPLSIATQAEMETATATDKIVTPGRVKFSPHALKVWAAFQVDATLDANLNVDSITDTGTGDWTVNITTDFSSAEYCAGANANPQLGTAANIATGVKSRAAGSFQIVSEDSGGTLGDNAGVGITGWAFGDQ